jgi:monovalent cation:H+ antiporter-2, CPA2 family
MLPIARPCGSLPCMSGGYFHDILILLIIAVAVLALFLRLRLPPILGYLTIGALVGPYGLGWIDDSEHTRNLAEFGVVLLLFTIGLEFSLSLLLRMKTAVLGLGGLQVLVTTLITMAIALQQSLPMNVAIVLGGVVAMSSTALVVGQLSEQGELHTRHGRNAVGILLFQDIIVIPFLILVSTLSGTGGDEPGAAMGIAMGKGLLALVLILGTGRWLLRPLLRGVARFRSAELFTLTTLLVALGAAWITHELGLSLALGAFLAGMMLGETEFRHQLDAEIRPFRSVLLGLFFITIGMLLNLGGLLDIWPWVLLLLVVLVFGKLVVITGFCRVFGWDPSVSLRTGLVLAHGGEFGFAILTLALGTGLIPAHVGQVVLAALLLSMAIAPMAIRFNGPLTQWLLPGGSRLDQKSRQELITITSREMQNHVILCGYGRVGQNIAGLLRKAGVPYTGLDLDPAGVRDAIQAGEPVNYGDAANLGLLQAAGLERAAAVVVSVEDFSTALKILHRVRQTMPDIPVLVRTADRSGMDQLRAAGATKIIPETIESSLLLASNLLQILEVPTSHIDEAMAEFHDNPASTGSSGQVNSP